MHNCDSLDPLVTPFVDGALPDADRRAVEDHLRRCPPCHSRVTAERAVHELLQARRPTLCRTTAPDALHLRCADAVHANAKAVDAKAQKRAATAELQNFRDLQNQNLRTPHPTPRTPNPLVSRRLGPVALAASLVVVVGGAFLYQA